MRPYLWPAVFLLAVTVAVVGLRAAFRHSSAPSSPNVTHVAPAKRYYLVRAGDTLAAVAAKTGVPATQLFKLNPNLTPTALFLGQRIRLK